MAGKSYKQVKTTGTVGSFISDAFGEWQSLRDEMTEWKDNLEEKFSQTSKYETVSNTADTLDNHADNEPDVPEVACNLETGTTLSVKYGKERGSESRETRNSNAISLVEAAVGAIDDKISELEGKADDLDNTSLEEVKEAYDDEPTDEHGLMWLQVASQYALGKLISQEEADKVKETVMEAFPELDVYAENVDEVREQITALEELRDSLNEVTEELNSLEFPGMYG